MRQSIHLVADIGRRLGGRGDATGLPRPSSDWRRPSPRQRALAIALTLCAELIFVILFLGLAPKVIEQVEAPGEPVTFDLAPPAPKAKTPPRKAKAEVKARKRLRRSASRSRRRCRRPRRCRNRRWSNSARRSLPRRTFPSSAIQGDGGRERLGDRTGRGPGRGAAAQCRMGGRADRRRACRYYMPNGTQAGSSAEIACKTIANYRVEELHGC